MIFSSAFSNSHLNSMHRQMSAIEWNGPGSLWFRAHGVIGQMVGE
jgi:hypothetical protein